MGSPTPICLQIQDLLHCPTNFHQKVLAANQAKYGNTEYGNTEIRKYGIRKYGIRKYENPPKYGRTDNGFLRPYRCSKAQLSSGRIYQYWDELPGVHVVHTLDAGKET